MLLLWYFVYKILILSEFINFKLAFPKGLDYSQFCWVLCNCLPGMALTPGFSTLFFISETSCSWRVSTLCQTPVRHSRKHGTYLSQLFPSYEPLAELSLCFICDNTGFSSIHLKTVLSPTYGPVPKSLSHFQPFVTEKSFIFYTYYLPVYVLIDNAWSGEVYIEQRITSLHAASYCSVRENARGDMSEWGTEGWIPLLGSTIQHYYIEGYFWHANFTWYTNYIMMHSEAN